MLLAGADGDAVVRGEASTCWIVIGTGAIPSFCKGAAALFSLARTRIHSGRADAAEWLNGYEVQNRAGRGGPTKEREIQQERKKDAILIDNHTTRTHTFDDDKNDANWLYTAFVRNSSCSKLKSK